MKRLTKNIRTLLHLDPPPPLHATRLIWRNVPPSIPRLHEENMKVSNRVKTSRYEVWNFVFISLFEQFKKSANIYFLFLATALLVLQNMAPVSPLTTILPLLFVTFLTMAKQAYEDYQRHKSDNLVNQKLITVLERGSFVQRPAESIKLGDIIKVEADDDFPCDLVLLASSTLNGSCYITTVNFDGETNLKLRYCVPETADMHDPLKLQKLACVIECDLPNHELYKFAGKFSVHHDDGSVKNTPLTMDNFLLRGAKLRNTDFIVGIAVYTGPETKMALNQQKKRHKVSVVDIKLDRYILLMIVVLGIGSSILSIMRFAGPASTPLWYMDPTYFSTSRFSSFIDIMCFMGLLNHVIPISLYVTLEIQKFWNAFFIDWDLDMYYSKTDDPARANSSDTIEELGQIEYIFTDKTGTLTENKMIFKKCVIGNDVYVKRGDYLEFLDRRINHENMSAEALQFFIFVCICHTAEARIIGNPKLPSRNSQYKYLSPSPDEVSLLNAANSIGIMYKGCNSGVLLLEVGSTEKCFKIKHILEFDASRKRMSVVYQDENDDYFIITKGADSHVLCLSSASETRGSLQNHIDEFANEGLRTLAFGYKKLSVSEYENINSMLKAAELSVLDRDKEIKAAYAAAETDLTLVGATGVDDRLQSGVVETLRDLRMAGIKIWVLTGDKEETAVSISLKCGHLSPLMTILYLCNRIENLDAVLNEYISRLANEPTSNFALVIDGVTFKMVSLHHSDQILKVFSVCKTVLCCRMSPLQKSKVVKFVRKSFKPSPITLAIGDGANDCSMIQEAHVGIGIMGQEGRQAVYSSDFAIHRFKYLRKLLLYHGYNFYNRISVTILYFFYKNLLFCFPMFLFVWYTNFSPTSLFQDAEITMYNTLITSMPVMLYGIFEQPYRKSTLLARPQIYRSIARNKLMDWTLLFFWIFNALWQSLVIFYWCYFTYNDGLINVPDHYFTLRVFGTMAFSYVVICATIQIQLLTRFWTLHTVVSTVGSLLYFVIAESFVSLLYEFDSGSTAFSSEFHSYYAFFNMLAYPHFWCGLVTIIPIAFFPYLISTFTTQYFRSRSYGLSKAEYNINDTINLPDMYS